MRVGKILKLLRTAEGLSQTALAVQLGVARTYLSQIESCRLDPGLPFLKAVSKRFGIPLPLLVLDDSFPDHEVFGELQKILAGLLIIKIRQQKVAGTETCS